MSIFKSTTPSRVWPSTDATMTMLVGDGREPAVTASASMLAGGESVFARVEVDDMPKDRSRHAAHFALIGRRDAVLAVLEQLRTAVDQAQPPESLTD